MDLERLCWVEAQKFRVPSDLILFEALFEPLVKIEAHGTLEVENRFTRLGIQVFRPRIT